MRLVGCRGPLWIGRAALVLGLVVAGWAMVTWISAIPAASGHAIILESSPKHQETVAAPSRLMLRFNSRIEKKLCSVSLIGPGQTTILLLRQEPDAPSNMLIYQLPVLGPGAYRVKWTVLAVDGHVTQGTLVFSVADGKP